MLVFHVCLPFFFLPQTGLKKGVPITIISQMGCLIFGFYSIWASLFFVLFFTVSTKNSLLVVLPVFFVWAKWLVIFLMGNLVYRAPSLFFLFILDIKNVLQFEW